MPKNLVDVSTFTDPVVSPVDGDALVAASVEVGLQGLSNRSRELADRIGGADGTGDWLYPDGPRARVTVIPLHTGMLLSPGVANAWRPTLANGELVSDVANDVIAFSLGLPDGAILDAGAVVSVRAKPGSTNTMQVKLYQATKYWTGAATVATLHASAVTDGTSNEQTVLLSLSLPVQIFNTTPILSRSDEYFLEITAGASTAQDKIKAIEIAWTDPGPRNY